MTDLERFEKLTGYECNLDDPQTHCEWLMWYKRNCRDPLLTLTADKIAVRDYVRDAGYGYILNDADCYYSTDGVELVPPCVVKMNNASGRNVFVRDESQVKTALRSVEAWLTEPYGDDKCEWAYEDIKPGFVVEQMLWGDGEPHTLYRLLCWGGTVRYVEADEYAIVRGVIQHGAHTVFTLDWKKVDVTLNGKDARWSEPPTRLDDMIEIAGVLSKPFRFARVDLYEIDEWVGFSEITHYPRSGKYRYEPREFDELLGGFWR